MNKAFYEILEITVVELTGQDIVTTSSPFGDDNETQLPWLPLFSDE